MFTKLRTTIDERLTTTDKKQIAIGYLSDSGDLNMVTNDPKVKNVKSLTHDKRRTMTDENQLQ